MPVDEESSTLPTLAERRALIERVAASAQFSRSARIRDFLFYVDRDSLKDGVPEIHEQEIGIRVFGRSPRYDRSQNNIVRVNATELRRRIDAYFGGEGAEEPLISSIPKGGYRPVFRWRDAEEAVTTVTAPAVAVELIKPAATATSEPLGKARLPLGWIVLSVVLAIACGALLWQNRSLRKGINYGSSSFIMSVLEKQSDIDCSTLLGCSRRDVVIARELALKCLANTCNGHNQAS